MPLQELSPPPAVTGYSQLGQALTNAGANYAGNARQDQLLAQARANQLADIEAKHVEGDKDYARNRAAQLADIASQRGYEGTVRGEQAGYHTMEQALLYTYQEAAKIAEEKRRLEAQAPDKANAQKDANTAAELINRLAANKLAVSRIITTPAPQTDPSAKPVSDLALRLAQQSTGKEHPPAADVASMRQKATEMIDGMVMVQHAQVIKGANDALIAMKETERDLNERIRNAGTTMHVFPTIPPPPMDGPSLFGPQAQALRPVGVDALGSALGKVIPQGPPPAASNGPGVMALIENPTNNPVIDQGNAALKQQQVRQTQLALNAAREEGRQIETQLAGAAQPTQAVPLMADEIGFGNAMQPMDPVAAAQKTADLLKKKALNAQKVKALEAASSGPTVFAAPAQNTPGESTPAFDQAPGSPPPIW